MRKHYFLLTIIFLTWSVVRAQERIDVHTRNMSLVFNVGADKKLYQSYMGSRIAAAAVPADTTVESYPQGGGSYLFEPAIRMVHADGNPSLDLRVASWKVDSMDTNVRVTSILMKDPVYPVSVVLELRAYSREDVITSKVLIRHDEPQPVKVSHFASSMLHFHADSYWLTQFHGDWAREMHMDESRLTSGIKIVDSKLGSRADMYQTPAFLLSLDRSSSEEEGEVLAGTLAWSGSFQLLFEVDEKDRLSVAAGMNPYASDYVLDPGKTLPTPEFIFTYSNKGRGQASRNLHAWARSYGVLNGKGPRMTLLNNWESTQFAFNEPKLDSLFGETRKLGADLFLLDDGWFGNKYPRNDDHTSLGDWQENKTKLPHGIARLEKAAAAQGVKFGIWVEPEMVSPKSELYEKHPDWVLKLPNRSEHYFRNQLVLDLVNPAVQDFVFKTVDDLLTQHSGIAYIKWDCNRMMTNEYSPYLGFRQTNLYVDYVRSLYAVLDRLRAKHPSVPMMLCSGGGGRTDYGALKYFTEFWPSDNTDAVERVYIQWGYSYFFPANTIACHVTSWGKEPLKFRTDVAMMGRLGYDLDVSKMKEKELAFSQQALKDYRRLSGTIGQGDLFRLLSPYDRERAALMYVDADKKKAVLFGYVLYPRYGSTWPPVKLQGLDGQKSYRVREINRYPGVHGVLVEDGKKLSGEYLMKVGLNILRADALSSAVIEITEE
ncbi:MAG: alpha-galactosidase [Bacteroidetes bacterium]|nr:alpha-galactosidase [Bacteroidota bacterium]